MPEDTGINDEIEWDLEEIKKHVQELDDNLNRKREQQIRQDHPMIPAVKVNDD